MSQINSNTPDDLLKDTRRLGIEVTLNEFIDDVFQYPSMVYVEFKSTEDLNLYRMIGKFKEDWYYKFGVKRRTDNNATQL